MGMNNRVLRACYTACAVVLGYLLSTINGESLITQSGFRLRSIQDA